MEYYEKDKESSCIQYWNKSSLYCWVISHKLLVDGFQWVGDIPNLNKNLKQFIKLKKNMTKKLITDIFLKQMLNILKMYII